MGKNREQIHLYFIQQQFRFSYFKISSYKIARTFKISKLNNQFTNEALNSQHVTLRRFDLLYFIGRIFYFNLNYFFIHEIFNSRFEPH